MKRDLISKRSFIKTYKHQKNLNIRVNTN